MTIDIEPTITFEQLNAKVANVQQAVHAGRLTICIVTMANGWVAVGTALCATEAGFNEDIGAQLAYEDALQQVLRHELYAARDRTMVRTDTAAPAILLPPGVQRT